MHHAGRHHVGRAKYGCQIAVRFPSSLANLVISVKELAVVCSSHMPLSVR